MDPLAREFSLLKDELKLFKFKLNLLKYQMFGALDENKALLNELKQIIQMRYVDFSESEVGLLEQKLHTAVASKNEAVKMWQLALKQLERQEKMLLGEESIVATERSELEKKILQVKYDYDKSLNILSGELSTCRDEISELKKKLVASNLELNKCKKDLNAAEKELDNSKKSILEYIDNKDILTKENFLLQSSISDLDKSLSISKESIFKLTTENAELSMAVSKLEEENKKLKSQTYNFEKVSKESLLAAEEAVLEKKEIICKEEQYKSEIKRLKSSIDVAVEKTSLRFKAEISEIKKKSTEEIKDLCSTIDSLHKQIGEKQNMFERANREKRALESKFELLFSENSNGMSVSQSTFDDLCKRLTMAEKARNELELKVLSLETSIQETKSAKDQEIQYLSEKQHSLNDRLKTLSRDFNQTASDKLRLSVEFAKLTRKSAEQEKECFKMRKEYTDNIQSLKDESRNKQQSLREQLKSTEEHYKNLCSELQNLLEAEFKICNKLKVEFADLISQSDAALRELFEENGVLKESNTELINILHQNNLPVPSDILMSLT